MIRALATDPRFFCLTDRKAVAVELVTKSLDQILSGDDGHPSNWLRIIDICRQEAGLAPLNVWNEQP